MDILTSSENKEKRKKRERERNVVSSNILHKNLFGNGDRK